MPYGGADLSSDENCWWQVRVWDQDGRPSEYSQPSAFTMGLLGGRNRDRIPIYNTCLSHGSCRDAQTWMEGRGGQLAAALLDQGIRR